METQGGHIEAGETPLMAAHRDITDAVVFPVCDYYGYDSEGRSKGMVFESRVNSLGTLPDFEMKEARVFDALSENLTYPCVTPILFAEAEKAMKRKEHRK